MPCTPHYGPTNPPPESQQHTSGVRRFLECVELIPREEARYRQMHAEVWPEVVAAIRRANIRNYSIYVTTIAGKRLLIRYFEYTGADPASDFASIAEDPTVRDKWWPLTDGIQERLAGTPDGEQWLPAEMVMLLD